jgi:hypothetical protein
MKARDNAIQPLMRIKDTMIWRVIELVKSLSKKSDKPQQREYRTSTGTRELSSTYSAAPLYLARPEAPSELF